MFHIIIRVNRKKTISITVKNTVHGLFFLLCKIVIHILVLLLKLIRFL